MRAVATLILATLTGGCPGEVDGAPPLDPPGVPPSRRAPASPRAPAPPPRVRIAASGDLVLNPHAMRAVEDDGEDGYVHLLAGYAAALDGRAAIAFVNVEQPLVNEFAALDPGWPRQDPSRPRRSPVLGATPALASALAAAGVDVASVANNHAYDQGLRGLRRTVEVLEAAGVRPVGAGPDAEAAFAPVVIERSGARIAFLAVTDFFNQHPRDAAVAVAARAQAGRVEAALRRARALADVVVLSVHWSRDFAPRVRSAERRRARALVEAGADVILGAGPHVLHEVERLESPRGDAVVAYSLGNLVSGMGRTYRVGHPPRGFVHPANVTPEARDGVVLHIDLSVQGGAIRVTSLEAEPLWTRNNWLAHRRAGVPHRISVVRLADAVEEVRLERHARIAAALGPAVSLR